MKTFNRAIKLGGHLRTINGVEIRALEYDNAGDVLRCTGTTVPTGTGYAKGCLFIKTDAATGTKGLYENQGVNTSASFNLVGDITSAEISFSDTEFIKDNNGLALLAFAVLASAVNEVTIANATTGNKPIFSSTGEADIGFEFHNDQAEQILILQAIATAINELKISNAAAGGAPILEVTGGDTDIGLELTPKGVGYVDITNGGLQVVAQALTPAADDGVGSTIEDGAVHIDVGAVANDADDWITLPALTDVPVGHTITILCNATTDFELRTPNASDEEINSVDCDGDQEYVCTDTEIIKVIKIDNTIGWMAHAFSAVGAVVAAVTPD